MNKSNNFVLGFLCGSATIFALVWVEAAYLRVPFSDGWPCAHLADPMPNFGPPPPAPPALVDVTVTNQLEQELVDLRTYARLNTDYLNAIRCPARSKK